MFEAQFWKLLRNSEAQPKFTLSFKKNYVYSFNVRPIGMHFLGNFSHMQGSATVKKFMILEMSKF